jgi:hypothetical protein
MWDISIAKRQQADEGRVNTNHGDISAGHGGFHELLGSGLCDRAKIVDKISLGHADTSVADGEDTMLLVRGDADVEVLLRVELGGILQGLVADLVEGIRCIGDELSQEDFLHARTLAHCDTDVGGGKPVGHTLLE